MAAVRRHGAAVYIVGGAVREWVWAPEAFNPETIQWDLTTNLSPQILEVLSVSNHPGREFGTFRLGPHVEVTIMRHEGVYADHRHPKQIVPAVAIEEDLSRRDFTVNAVAWDGTRVVAAANSLRDLRDRRLRCVGDPYGRFLEDPLRMLRLLRFSAKYDQICIDPKTWSTLLALRGYVRTVSQERRLEEFLRFLESPLSRWHLWHEAGMDDALHWSPQVLEPPCDVAWVVAPDHPAARIAAYRLMTAGTWAGLAEWAQHWPIPRSWRAGLCALGTTVDLKVWRHRAQCPYERQAWVFRELAVAAGIDRETLGVRHLALSALDVQTGWGFSGPALGRVLRHLDELVARDPALNNKEQLARVLDACTVQIQE
jgi:hypothetical protein